MRDEAERRIGYLYPQATLPDGSNATVIAWLWARTVRSPDPAAKGAMVPLVSSWLLSTKQGKQIWVEPVIDPTTSDGYRFEVYTGTLTKVDEERLKAGTKTGRGANFVCLLTGAAITGDYIKAEGVAGRLGSRLLAIVAEGKRSRLYLPPSAEHEQTACKAAPVWKPDGELPNDPRNFWTVQYGLDTFASLFTSRQLAALTTFSDLVGEARMKAVADTRSVGPNDDTPLSKGGTGAAAYSDALATYLALAVSKLSATQSSIGVWKPSMEQAIAAFGRQAIAMSWDFPESNPFAGMAGDIQTTIHNMMRVLDGSVEGREGAILNIAAQRESPPVRPVLISTDPPYYDNIGYADLSDFFYIWMRRPLVSIWPDLFRRLNTPKDDELVATPYRHGGREKAEAFFMDGMSRALSVIHTTAFETCPLTVYYAFKQSEAGKDGTTSAGWASFLQAIVDSGFVIDGTWPVRTELVTALKADVNALASCVVLVCRKRIEQSPVITRADFLRDLRRELPIAMKEIIAARVGPVDFEQAVIGPGMGVFSRYSKVLEEDDSPMSVKTALALINRARLEVDPTPTGNFDPETQVAIAWFQTYGYAEKPSGEAILLANAKGVALQNLFASGVFYDGQGKVRLVKRDDLPANWSPVTDRTATVWECLQHTARALDQGGSTPAAALIKAMGSKAEDALSLAYRLYDIANTKGDAMEARVYAELAAEWPELETLAASLSEDTVSRSGPAQASLFG